jgi:putative membrane protein
MTDEDMASTRSRSATSLELASRNTGLAVQRTRMNADRTLMSVIRTSLRWSASGLRFHRSFRNSRKAKRCKGTAPRDTVPALHWC